MNLFTNIQTMTWQQSWELLAWTMCYFLAAGTVVALVGALVRFLCKRLAPQIRYAASLAVFATLAALPFGIALGLSQRTPVTSIPNSIVIDLAKTPIVAHSQVEPTKQTHLPILPPLTPPLVEIPTTEAVPFAVALAGQNDGAMGRLVDRAIEFLPWVWIVGTPLTFLLLATGLIGSNRLRRQCKQLTEGPIFDACERLRTMLAVSQRVGIAINERIASPLLIGIVRPMILLPPAALSGWSPDELEMVLLHELAHVRRWDNLVNFGQRLVESLLFFHPAVWWVSRWVRRDREECCDAVVVAQTATPQAYAELLVALATPTPPLAGLALAQHPLAGRIRRILHLEEEKMLITRSTLGLVGFFVVALLGIVLWQPTTPSIAQETKSPVAPGSAGGLPEDKATEDRESTEEKEKAEKNNEIQNQEAPLSVFTIFIPENHRNELNYPLWIELLAKQGFRASFVRANAEGIIQDALVMSVPAGANPQVVWEGHNDGKRPQMRPRVILNNPPTASNYASTTSWSGVYQGGTVQQQNGLNVPASNQPSPFPTLEAQRSADLAYKLLHVELEPLNKEELARVKAMKFAGGLRVASGKNLSGGMGRGGPFHSDDILVGLHVWPTTSLADVKKVLDRDDLQDLSPLKFYVIRKALVPVRYGGGMGAGMGGYGEEAEPKTVDQLVTGRIEVNVDAVKKTVPYRLMPPANRIMTPVPMYSPPPYDPFFPRSPHTPGVIVPDPRSLPNIAIGKPIDPAEDPLFPNQPSQPKPTLLYDGKTFDQWKSSWRRDLSIDLRIKAIRAFVAFANAGKGKEAADEIMAIAAGYDWTSIGDNGVTEPLQLACKAAFAERQLPTDVAVEAVIAAKDSKKARVRTFVLYTLQGLSAADQKSNELLREAFPKAKLRTFEEHNRPSGAFGVGGGTGGGGF